MKLDAFIQWFMPKEEKFHLLLERDTANLVLAAERFLAIARSRSLEERRIKLVELKAIEHDGDEITRQIFEALNSSFITPIDREDLRSIAVDLDDILDFLEAVAKNLDLFEIDESPEPLTRFAEILLEMTQQIDLLTRMLWDLGNEPKIRAGLVRVSELENQADALYLAVIGDLFRAGGKRDAIEVLKWKEIYQGLEDACDLCKDFTHVVGNIVIKNA